MRQTDVYMAIALVLILAVLLVPVAPVLLDGLLALSIGLGLLVLLLTTQVRDPLHFSAFPSLLLMLTLFRLALNVATTRQILLNAYAGRIIQAFGQFVVGGNHIVGAVIFLILTTINFVVITRGAQRIAEVAARFTLDSMPGKQMSIDADLNAGLIDEKTAMRRREELNLEADFFGAMDGASRFVRGDAIAGLVITVINVVGGFGIGVGQRGMTSADALSTYTLLTIGDGLVAQIPALVISTAAAMLVTRAASNETLGGEVERQVFLRADPLMLTGGILCAMALAPGLPTLPFLTLGGAVAGTGYWLRRSGRDRPFEGTPCATGAAPAEAGEKPRPASMLLPRSVTSIPPVSPLDLEIGFGLVPLVDARQGGRLIERIGHIRTQLAEELGFLLPAVNVRDNIRLKNTDYAILIRGIEVARGSVRPGLWLAIRPRGAPPLEGHVAVKEPAFGCEAYWIPADQRDAAERKGLTVVDAATAITTHLAEVAKQHAADLLTRQNVSDMLEALKESHAAVIQELLPNRLSIGVIHRVLQRLLRERVSIRDLPSLLECLADQASRTQDPGMLAEFCRKALGAQLTAGYVADDGSLAAVGLHPDTEAELKKAIRREANELGTLLLEPAAARRLLTAVREAVERARERHPNPLLLCGPLVRSHLRQLIEHELPSTPVFSFAEVPETVTVNLLEIVQVPHRLGASPEAEPIRDRTT